jgi:phage gp46-like protein
MVQISIDVPRDTVRPALPFDLIWQSNLDLPLSGQADFALAEPDEANNRGGLRAKSPLETAIIMLLFTNRRRPDEIEDNFGSTDRQGWAGDSFDIDGDAGEQELGSLLWTLGRSELNQATLIKAKDYAREALTPLIRQKIVQDFTIEAEFDNDRMALRIAAIGADEGVLLDRYFEV